MTDLYIDPTAIVSKYVRTNVPGPVHIGAYSRIGGFSIIRDHSNITSCNIGTYVEIGQYSNVAGSTIGDFTTIGPRNRIESNVYIGSHVRTDSNVIIEKFAKIDSYAHIRANTVVERNAVVISAPTSSDLYSSAAPFDKIDQDM